MLVNLRTDNYFTHSLRGRISSVMLGFAGLCLGAFAYTEFTHFDILSAAIFFALVALAGSFVLKSEFKPLEDLNKATEILAAGEKLPENMPLRRRADEIGRLANGLANIQLSHDKLESLAYFDPLTKAANRAFFMRQLNKCTTSVSVPSALFMIDLDRFKEVNDALGHAAGDELLIFVTNTLKNEIRGDDFLARLGGDEFAILIYNDADAKAAGALAKRITTILARPILLPQGEVSIGSSIGIALLPHDGETPHEALRNADLALYKAKENGRGQHQFYEPTLNHAAQERMVIGNALRHAIEHNELSIHFQPQIKTQDNTLHGLEALARWHHPERGNIPPSDFIPIAESSGLIVALGNWMIDESCRIGKVWLDSGFDFKHISVNVSPMQMRQPDFVNVVKAAIKRHKLPAEYLCLEVTENIFVSNAEERIKTVLIALGKEGIQLSLDDFGTGYSSLGYLNRLPFKQIKIDRMFVNEVDKDSRRLGLLRGVIGLIKGLGMQVVAEGAETQEEVELLNAANIDAVQGYFFSKSIPTLLVPLEIDKLLRTNKLYKHQNIGEVVYG